MTLDEIKQKLGLTDFPNLLFVPLALTWCALFLVLLIGLFWILFGMPRVVVSSAIEGGDLVLRYSLLSIAALTATLGAVVTLPLTLIRTRFAARTTHATEQDLITDRINKAVEMLGTEKVMKIPGKDDAGGDIEIEKTVPNMEVRIGAIHALARLARENLNFHVQIMEILCAYIRENAPADGAEPLHMPQMPADDVENPR